jgi:hypothetical protein
MPKQAPLIFKPTWKISRELETYRAPANLQTRAEKAHIGLRYLTVGVMGEKPKGGIGETLVCRVEVTSAEAHVRPGLPPLAIAQICTAIAQEHANKAKRRATYGVVFYGVGTPEDPKPRSRCQFICAPEGGVVEEAEDEAEPDPDGEGDDGDGDEDGEADDEGGDEGDDDDDGDGDGDDDGDEEEEEEEEEIPEVDSTPLMVGDDGDAPANPYARPGSRHEAGAPRIQHMPPDAYDRAFPPQAAPTYPDPRSMGRMTAPNMGMDQYQSSMHPAQALFLHHLGGVFAETRASMREMRQDVREARTEAKNANQRVLELASMSTAHYENMHKASQVGWNALHQGMTMQLNALQNSSAWERRIVELQSNQQNQGNGLVQTLMAFAPQAMALVAALKGVPPEAIAQLVGGAMPGMMPPGAMPPGAMPPGGMPPGGAPPGAQPPPPPPAPPPPGFNGGPTGAPPQGFPGGMPPGPGPQGQGAPPPGFQAGPPHPGAAPQPPHPGAGVQAPPGHTPYPHPHGGAPFVGGPAPGAQAPSPGAFGAAAPGGAMGAGPFARMDTMPPQQPAPPPEQSGGTRRTEEEARARFTRAPLASMCEALVVTSAGVLPQVAQACGQGLVDLLNYCALADTDSAATEQFRQLELTLGGAGVMPTAMSFLGTEQRALLSDIRLALAQHLSQQNVNAAFADGPGGSGPSPYAAPDPATFGAAGHQPSIPFAPAPPPQPDVAPPTQASSEPAPSAGEVIDSEITDNQTED